MKAKTKKISPRFGTLSNHDAKAYIAGETTKKPRVALVLLPLSKGDMVQYVGTPKGNGGKLDLLTMAASAFDKEYIGLVRGEMKLDDVALEVAAEMLIAGKITNEATDALEGVLKMDTRGKSSDAIREECERIAVDLPEGHALRNVPPKYTDRASAIAAYTAIRQALFAANRSTTSKEQSMAKKVAKDETKTPETKADETKADETKAKTEEKPEGKKAASKDAKAVADKASEKKGATKTKADFSGKYKVGGKAEKVKSTEELGMHADSVRTKVLAVVLASKAKDGVDYAKLEEAAGAKTRGAVAYLVKKGMLVRVNAGK